MIRNQPITITPGDQLDFGRLDFVDLGFSAEEWDYCPIVGKTLRLIIDQAANLIAFNCDLVASGKERRFHGRPSLFGGLNPLRRLPKRFQFAIRKRDAGFAEIGGGLGRCRPCAGGDRDRCELTKNVFNHAPIIAPECEAMMKLA